MDNIILDNIDIPILKWKYDKKKIKYDKLICVYFNNSFSKFIEKENNDFIDKNIKIVYPTFNKKNLIFYKKCIKQKENISYILITEKYKIQVNLIYYDINYIYEKLDLIRFNDKYSHDLFNMIIIINNDNELILCNKVFTEISGYKINEIKNKNINSLFYDKLNLIEENNIESNFLIMSNKILINIDYYYIKFNDVYKIIIMKDITILHKNLIYNKICEELKTGIAVFKNLKKYFETFKCIEYNNIIKQIFDIKYDFELIHLFNEDIYFKLKNLYTNILLNNNSNDKIEIFYKEKYYEINIFLIDITLFIIVINDITYIKNINLINKSMNLCLENMIDKIHKPISLLSNFINLLNDSTLNKIQKEYMNKLYENVNELVYILSDFTDYSNIKSNKIVLNNDSINIREDIQDYCNSLLLKIDKKELEFIYDIDNIIPPFILCDKYRFGQILLNLLSNAFKYTEKGKIILNIKYEKNNDTKFFLIIEVNDTGPGISIENQKKIFEPFYQIVKEKSSGLGLTITKELCELMGGSLSINSTLNVGSTFIAKISVEEFTDIEKIEEETLNLLNDKTIVIIDENIHNRINISKYLLLWKIKYYLVSSIEEIIFINNNYTIDALILDIDMNKMLGILIAEKINIINKNIPLIAMSSFEDISYNKNLFHSLIIKPINKTQLLKTLINIFFKKYMHINVSISDDIKTNNNISILLISDNEIKQKNIKDILYNCNYRKLDIFFDINDEKIYTKKYSVIFIDINTSIKLNSNIINKLKSNGLPYIIGLYSVDNNDIKSKYKKLQIDAFIQKPININEVKAILKIITRKNSIEPKSF